MAHRLLGASKPAGPSNRIRARTINLPGASGPSPPNEVRAPAPWLHGVYEAQELLNRGGYGEVYKAKVSGSLDIVAVKVPRYDENQHVAVRKKELEFEAKTLAGLNHRNVIRMVERTDGSRANCPAETIPMLVLELANRGSLRDLLIESHGRGLGELVAASFFEQLCHGLAYLHKKAIVHRDLKPDNLLVDLATQDLTASGHRDERLCWTLKIADFGSAKALPPKIHTINNSRRGTPAYLPPELIERVQHGGSGASAHIYDCKSDIYVSGLILFEMLSGSLFRKGLHPSKLMTKEETDRVIVQTLSGLADLGKDRDSLIILLKRMLHPNREERKNLAYIMQRAWVRNTMEEVNQRRTSAIQTEPQKRTRKTIVPFQMPFSSAGLPRRSRRTARPPLTAADDQNDQAPPSTKSRVHQVRSRGKSCDPRPERCLRL